MHAILYAKYLFRKDCKHYNYYFRMWIFYLHKLMNETSLGSGNWDVRLEQLFHAVEGKNHLGNDDHGFEVGTISNRQYESHQQPHARH